MSEKFPFIVIYGAPNLGKTVQAKMLSENLDAYYIKYPVYDLSPTGTLINAALRQKRPIESHELQRLYAQNRRDFEPALRAILKTRPVVAEDYTKTGIIWGQMENIQLEDLLVLNKDLLVEDIGILLDGERFISGKEKGHRFEESNWEKARRLHLDFAKKYNWEKVNAHQTREQVSSEIKRIIEQRLLMF